MLHPGVSLSRASRRCADDTSSTYLSRLPLPAFSPRAQGEIVCRCTNEKVPYFNAGVYLENKTPIGKVDEIFGAVTESMFTVKCAEGVIAASFKPADKVYIAPDKLLPMARFLQPEAAGGGARVP